MTKKKARAKAAKIVRGIFRSHGISVNLVDSAKWLKAQIRQDTYGNIPVPWCWDILPNGNHGNLTLGQLADGRFVFIDRKDFKPLWDMWLAIN